MFSANSGCSSVLLEVRFANDRPAFHRPMILRAGKRIRFARVRNRRAHRKVRRPVVRKRVGVETEPCSRCGHSMSGRNPSARPSDVIRHAGLNPNRTAHRRPSQVDFDHVRVFHAQFARGLAAHQHGVVPDQFRRSGPAIPASSRCCCNGRRPRCSRDGKRLRDCLCQGAATLTAAQRLGIAPAFKLTPTAFAAESSRKPL